MPTNRDVIKQEVSNVGICPFNHMENFVHNEESIEEIIVKETDIDSNKIDSLLILEYQMCNEGYNNRDILVQEEFNKIISLFVTLAGIEILFNSLMNTYFVGIIGSVSIFLINAIIGFFGLIAFFALLIDMEASSSCKKSLRLRCQEIERRLRKNQKDVLLIWDEEDGAIKNRKKMRGERILRKLEKRILRNYSAPEAVTNLFSVVGMFIIGLWFVLILLYIVISIQKIWNQMAF